MGILKSTIRFFGCKGKDEESSEKPCCLPASLYEILKNLLHGISSFHLFKKTPRKSDPIIPVKNPLVSGRNHTLIQRISSPVASYKSPAYLNPETEAHVASSTSACVSPADLESQRDLSKPEIESHFGFSSCYYVPPSDLKLQRDYSSSEDEDVHRHKAEQLASSSTIWEEGSNYSTLSPSLAYINALDLVDSAVFTENQINEQSPESSDDDDEDDDDDDDDEQSPESDDDDEQSPESDDDDEQSRKSDDDDHHQKVKTCLVSLAGKWIKHYNSNHRILLVGEGDFSFSACLAVAFGSAPYMIATSLDSAEFLKKNYKHAMNNIHKLTSRKSMVMHGIDATEIANHPLLEEIEFDRIVFNFPFAGFFKDLPTETQLRKHCTLVSLFMKNGKEMLSENGEVHISHKTNDFHKEWKLEDLASCHGLKLIEAVKFTRLDYPGYYTKCGFGGDNNFYCHPSKTYKFGLKRRSSPWA